MSKNWGKEVKKSLIDKDIKRQDMARAINTNYSVMCAVINGNINRPDIVEKINNFLKIR